MDKIAVTGPYGRLGGELVKRGCTPIEASVTDFYELNKNILDIKPDVIIHCAAKTNVDACETQAIEAMKVNAGGTCGLCAVFSGKIVYISTDYIFSGDSGPYSEADSPNPLSIYGWSKLGGEIALRNRQNADDLIIRTTVLFDKHGDNFVTRIIDQFDQRQTIEVPKTLYGSPTYIPHLAEGILASLNQSGVLNIAGSEVMSRYTLAWDIGQLMGVDVDKLIFDGPVYGKAPRPLKAGLLTDKAQSLNIPIYHPMDGVREVLDALETVAAW